MKQLWPAFAFFLILIIGISSRISLLEMRDYWYDESFTGITIRQDWSAMNQIIVNDVHPPLYYWLLKIASLVIGANPISLRLFSVFFGVATIVLAFVALREWYPKSWLPAVLGSFIFAINPFLANYSQEARMYTLLGFLLLLAAFFLMRARQHNHRLAWLLYALTGAAILLTHYLGFIFMLGFFLYDAWQEWKSSPSKRSWKKHGRWFGLAYGIPTVIGLAWLPFFIKQVSVRGALGWVPNKALYELPVSLHIFLFGAPVGVTGVPPPLGYAVPWLNVSIITFLLTIALIVLIAWLTIKKRWDKQVAFLGFMTAFPLFFTWILQAVQLQLYVERFLSGSGVFFMLFLVAALWELPKQSWLVAGVSVYTVLVLFIQPYPYKTTFPLLAETAKQALPDAVIVSTSPFDFANLRFYLGEERRESLKLYHANNVSENFSSWALFEAKDQIFSLPTTPHLIITPQPQLFGDYRLRDSINGFSILEKS